MSARSQRCRIEKIEERIKKLSKYSSACICFPETEPPSFGFAVMRDIAFRVKCPLHGERFKVFSHLYVPRWHREHADRYRHLGSRQYQKAWMASFPLNLWPAVEEEKEEGIYLRLKDGTRYMAEAFTWRKPIAGLQPERPSL